MLIRFELGIAALMLAIAFFTPPLDSTWLKARWRPWSSWFRRIAARRALSVVLIGAFAFIGSAAQSLLIGIPEPRVQDEFSYLLAADTFAQGRMTNPTHPMWRHFESIHIIQQPTYASKYPPGQGLILAAGQLLGVHPIVGVWLSVGLAAAAICWMLQAWVPPRWALIAVLITLFQVRDPYRLYLLPGGFMGYWSQSYWGGALAATGGALVFGAFRRMIRVPRIHDSLLLALGLAILANTRPFEGLIVSVPVAASLLSWMIRQKTLGVQVLFEKIVLPILLVLIVTAGAMGFYNFRVTGSALRFPYQVHEEVYGIAPLFLFQGPKTEKSYNHQFIRDFHMGWSLRSYTEQHTISGFIHHALTKIVTLWEFYLRPILTIPLVATLPFVRRDRWMRFVLLTCGALIVGLLLTTWVIAHYAAPITGLILVLIVQSMRHLRLYTWKGRPVGRRIVSAIPWVLAAWFLLVLGSRMTMGLGYDSYNWSLQRTRILANLTQQEGRHLVIVRYVDSEAQRFRPMPEWVYNGADIDGAKVVWAREMETSQNRKLLEYFQDRHAWLLTVDPKQFPPQVVPYPVKLGN